MVARTELETRLHRLSNRIECEMVDIVRDLMIESRCEAVSQLAWAGMRFVEALREARDGQEGGDA